MFLRRNERNLPQSSFTDSERNLILAAETLRDGERPSRSTRDDRPEERVSLFWRLFGGTVLSICALVVLSAYQSIAGNIQEVRGDLSRMREASGDLIRKDDFNTRTAALWSSLRDLQALQSSVSVLTNKQASLDQHAAAAERDHKELVGVSATMSALREKDVLLDKMICDCETARRELAREIQLLRERLAKLEGHSEKKAATP